MWRILVILVPFCVIASFVVAAPVYHNSRGPLYVVSAPEARKPYIEVRNSTYHGSGPREEARAMCSVRTLEINATANATITRRLHGVVTSKVRNFTYHGPGPREEARAMCSVRTLEINATANATITRRLRGVVTSRELHNSLQRLEVIIYGQMQQLWQSLDALRGQMAGNARVPFPDRRTTSFRYKPGV